MIDVASLLDPCAPPHLINYIMAEIALLGIRRSVAQNVEYRKVLDDPAHPLFGQVPPGKKIEIRKEFFRLHQGDC